MLTIDRVPPLVTIIPIRLVSEWGFVYLDDLVTNFSSVTSV